jgi:hypothetical protein
MAMESAAMPLFSRAPDVVSRRIRGEHVLVPIRRSCATLDSIYTLNATAGFIWERAGSGESPDAIARGLAAAFAVDEATAAADVARTLDDLLAAGALVREGA